MFSPFSKVWLAKDFRARFDDEITTIAYFGKKTGRPRNTVFGPGVRKQVDLNVAVEIALLLVKEAAREGKVIEAPLGKQLTEVTGLRLWAGNQMSRLTRFNFDVDCDNPVEAFTRAAGNLLPIGKRGQLKVCVATSGATATEIASFRDLAIAKANADDRRNRKRTAIIDRYHDFARSNDLTVEEAYAQFCENFQLPAVKRRANERPHVVAAE